MLATCSVWLGHHLALTLLPVHWSYVSWAERDQVPHEVMTRVPGPWSCQPTLPLETEQRSVSSPTANHSDQESTKMTILIRITHLHFMTNLRYWRQCKCAKAAATQTDTNGESSPVSEILCRPHHTWNVHQTKAEASDHAVTPNEDAE